MIGIFLPTCEVRVLLEILLNVQKGTKLGLAIFNPVSKGVSGNSTKNILMEVHGDGVNLENVW